MYFYDEQRWSLTEHRCDGPFIRGKYFDEYRVRNYFVSDDFCLVPTQFYRKMNEFNYKNWDNI